MFYSRLCNLRTVLAQAKSSSSRSETQSQRPLSGRARLRLAERRPRRKVPPLHPAMALNKNFCGDAQKSSNMPILGSIHSLWRPSRETPLAITIFLP
eukprot:351965-Chlamydomonas_euryale.AAC.10